MTTDSTITPELLDQLLANYSRPEDLTGENGLFKQLKKALIERALGADRIAVSLSALYVVRVRLTGVVGRIALALVAPALE
jgi:hypothetical protein